METQTREFQLYLQTTGGYTAQQRTHQGRAHLVVPVTMMVEGVHVGSAGPLLHTIAELGKFPESWNGIPVVIDHPEVNGHNISANAPDVIDARTVGRVYNTKVSGSKLKAEVWLDTDRLRQVSSVTLAQINAAEILEVSVGVFTEEQAEEGEWNGEQYNAVAINHRPDHLALLPGGRGACSVEDGCGIRANKKKGEVDVKEQEIELQVMKDKKAEGYDAIEIMDNTVGGLVERVETLRQKIDAMDSNDSVHYLREAFDDFVVYEVRFRMGGTKLYKQGYQINDSGVVELTGTPTEVQKKVEYVNINNGFVRTKPPKKEVNTMERTIGNCPRCLEKVNKLIANGQSKFVEDDRVWLLTLEETQLDKLAPEVVKEVKEVPVVDAAKVIKDYEDSLTPEARFAKLPADVQEQHNVAIRLYKARQDAMRKDILANTAEGVWTEDLLKTLNNDVLEGIYNSVKKEENAVISFALNAAAPVKTLSKERAPLLPTGIELEETKN